MNNYEYELEELRERISVLENAENKRIHKRKIQIIFKVVEFLVVVILLIIAYFYVNNKFIKPYKEKVDYVEEKINSVESFVQDKLEAFQKYNPFNKN